MAGNEIKTIFALIVAINIPRVVFESAIHLYFGPTGREARDVDLEVTCDCAKLFSPCYSRKSVLCIFFCKNDNEVYGKIKICSAHSALVAVIAMGGR